MVIAGVVNGDSWCYKMVIAGGVNGDSWWGQW